MKKIIMAVDDDDDMLALVSIILSKSGYDVRSDTTSTIINTIPDVHPDLIILDVNLKEEDGSEICKTLKDNVFTSKIPIILFSATPDLERIALENGADDYLSKPFESEDLLHTVKRLVPAA
jgi:DNA-binding response OmpR family regulator